MIMKVVRNVIVVMITLFILQTIFNIPTDPKTSIISATVASIVSQILR